MSDFFEEYGWLIQSIIGGSLGIELLMKYIVSDNGKYADLLKLILNGLM